MRDFLVACATTAGLLCATSARGDCIAGMRAATAGETQYFDRTYAALKEALPAAPAGWTRAPVADSTAGSFCSDAREGDFEVRLMASYTYRRPKEEGDRLHAEGRKVQAEIDALRQLPPEVAKERQAMLDKMSEANRASNKAAKEGNKTLARQFDAEADGYSRKGREIRDRYLASVQSQVAALEEKRKSLGSGDVSITVRIAANEHDPRPARPGDATEIVAGKSPVPKTTGLKVQGVRVVVEGAAPRRDEIAGAIDRDKLGRLVQ